MQRGVGAPRAPGVCPRKQLVRGRPASRRVRHGPHEPDIGGRESVGLAQAAHGDVLRGPFADPRQGAQAHDRCLEIPPRVEQERVDGGRLRKPGDRRGAGARHAEARDVGPRQPFGAREDVRQAMCRAIVVGARERLAEGLHQLPGEPRRRADGDLLPEDGTHGDLEPVEGAGNPKAGPFLDQRPQRRIGG